jgi:uncharacterized protein YlzI (FlbEa/FlbD family)
MLVSMAICFITLTSTNSNPRNPGKLALLNTNTISMIRTSDFTNQTEISLTSGKSILVKESIQEVKKQINRCNKHKGV